MGLSGAMFPGVRSVNSLIQVSKGSQKTGAQKADMWQMVHLPCLEIQMLQTWCQERRCHC